MLNVSNERLKKRPDCRERLRKEPSVSARKLWRQLACKRRQNRRQNKNALRLKRPKN